MTLEDYFNETRTVMVHLLYLTNAKSLDHDLSDNQRRTLEVLLENDDLTAGRITETLDIKPSSTTAIIKQLTKLQYVTKHKDMADSRITRIKLTDNGRSKAVALQERLELIDSIFFKPLSAKERQQLFELLQKMATYLSSDTYLDAMRQLVSDDRQSQRMLEHLQDVSRDRPHINHLRQHMSHDYWHHHND